MTLVVVVVFWYCLYGGVPENRTSPHITTHHRTSQIYGHNCTAHHLDRTAHHSV